MNSFNAAAQSKLIYYAYWQQPSKSLKVAFLACEGFELKFNVLFHCLICSARVRLPTRSSTNDDMNNVQKNFFKFLFILAVWSFLLIGLIKINNDNVDISGASLVSQSYLKKIPIHRNLLQKEKWNLLLDQTSTTSASERLMTFIDNEVLVDNRTGMLKETWWKFT